MRKFFALGSLLALLIVGSLTGCKTAEKIEDKISTELTPETKITETIIEDTIMPETVIKETK